MVFDKWPTPIGQVSLKDIRSLPAKQRRHFALSSFLAISWRFQVITPLPSETRGGCGVLLHASNTRLIQRESHGVETACFARWTGSEVQFIYNGHYGWGREFCFQRLCQLFLIIQIKNTSWCLNIHICLVGEPAIQMCADHWLKGDISPHSVPIQCPCWRHQVLHFSSEFLGIGVAKDICIDETLTGNQSQCSTYFCFGSGFQLLNQKSLLLLII